MSDKRVALVLSGGGARAAYQVGVLQALAEFLPGLELHILTGVSAGAINAVYLAAKRADWSDRVDGLAQLWSNIRVDRVVRSDSFTLLGQATRWFFRLSSGGLGVHGPKALLDTQPLHQFLEEHLEVRDGAISNIDYNLNNTPLQSVAITGSNYAYGRSVTWIQSREDVHVEAWQRAHRVGCQAKLHLSHVMASSAIPLVFPAIHVDGGWYGDGGLRLSAPLSPAVHLGAEKILAIGTRTHAAAMQPEKDGAYPPPAQIVGSVLDVLFNDHFDSDLLRLERINSLIRHEPDHVSNSLRKVQAYVIRPSVDLGSWASEHEAELPHAIRFLSRGLGTENVRSNGLLSLLLFEPNYVRRLIDLGYQDCRSHWTELQIFLAS